MLCHTQENSLFKINLARAIPNIGNHGSTFFNAGIGIAYEQKLGQSPVSLQADFTADYSYIGEHGQTLLEWALEPRFYYNLKKRIAQGKSANNLSANYLALRLSQSVLYDSALQQSELSTFATPVWGFQRRLFKRGYSWLSGRPYVGLWL